MNLSHWSCATYPIVLLKFRNGITSDLIIYCQMQTWAFSDWLINVIPLKKLCYGT